MTDTIDERSAHRTSIPGLPSALALLAGLLLTGLHAPAPVRAECDTDQPTLTLYGLAHDGRMTINGTTSKQYASEFDVDIDIDDDFIIIVTPCCIYIDPPVEVDIDHPEDPWSSLAVDGADRYALQRGGRIKKNDKTLVDLPWGKYQAWLDLVAEDGHTYAVRSDGGLAVDGKLIADLPSEGYVFRSLVYDGANIYTLRSDGAVFRDTGSTPLFQFQGGPGDPAGTDGTRIPTSWIALERDPTAPYVYALRADGIVFRGKIPGGDSRGEQVAVLPYVGSFLPNISQLYMDLTVGADGTWYALTGDGRVFTQDHQSTPLTDLPGSASESDRILVDVETWDDDWYALRSDGRVYRNGGSTEILDMAGASYGSLALSDTPPVLTDDTKKPKPTVLKTKTVVGTPLRIPVIVNDADTCTEDLVVTPTELPPGAVWEAETWTLVWDAPGPADKYKFKFDVSDGTNVKNSKYTLKIKDPDLDPEKNKAPLVTKYEDAQALIGFEYRVPIIVDDKDGDPLTITVDESVYPFTTGAMFDPETRVFSWTPNEIDQGTVTVKFKVTDGDKKETAKIKIKVKNSLIY